MEKWKFIEMRMKWEMKIGNLGFSETGDIRKKE